MNDNLACNYSEDISTEIVVCDSALSLKAHKDLFRFDSHKYIICDSPLILCLERVSISTNRIHLSLVWENIISIALWKERVGNGEVMLLMKETGLNETELKPFRNGNINDIFPVLFYGKNFDILRRLCGYAKRMAQDRLQQSGTQITCHMISKETGRIVASSL